MSLLITITTCQSSMQFFPRLNFKNDRILRNDDLEKTKMNYYQKTQNSNFMKKAPFLYFKINFFVFLKFHTFVTKNFQNEIFFGKLKKVY